MRQERLRRLLSEIYGPDVGDGLLPELAKILDQYRGKIPNPVGPRLSEHDAILITYADQVQEPGRVPLASLREFCDEHLAGLVSGVHILPFYPWSSDDGFSVVDYRAVADQYGSWDDVRSLKNHFRLMFDAVVNHTSAESPWFQGFLRDEPEFRDFYIDVPANLDLLQVVRPRALPLVTEFASPSDTRRLWTTFSRDQVDLNYHNPRVLLRILDTLLFYASQGADFLRLDAIAYLWKEAGTPCINLPQTHWVVQLMRAVLDDVAPHVMLITETNVPNKENVAYFGDGSNEAQFVYNFPLPPLVLHALHTGSAATLARWAAGLQLPSSDVTFLNFLASHDGIGLNPVRGILPESEIQGMADRIRSAGGLISNKTNVDGTESPYEMNVNYFDALNAAEHSLPLDVQVERFLTAHAILLSFIGMPAIYFHSLFGSRGWPEGVKLTGRSRSINRQKLERAAVDEQLADESSLRGRIFGGLSRLLKARRQQACFSPRTPQRVLEAPDSIFAVLREEPSMPDAVLCVHNVSARRERVDLALGNSRLARTPRLRDLSANRHVLGGESISLELEPYESLWLSG